MVNSGCLDELMEWSSVYSMNMRSQRTEPCEIPQVSGHDWDYASDVLAIGENWRKEIELSPKENRGSKTDSALLSNMLWSIVSKATEISRKHRQEIFW